MKILFSPSEAKFKGGEESPLNKNSFIFPELFSFREEVLNKYKQYISSATNEQRAKLFGTKKQEVIDYYVDNITQNELMKVIQRYDGVAYDYLSYGSLSESSQKYIDTNVLIFSNLFGVVLAGDVGLPDYKLKQGEKLGSFALESFYKKSFSNTLDNYLEDEDILDLRAGYYEKFYTINKPYITMKFIKGGKVVSHWSKAYRGMVLKLMAEQGVNTFDELMSLKIEGLKLQEIQERKNITTLLMEII